MQTWFPGHGAHVAPQRAVLVLAAQAAAVVSDGQRWKPASQVRTQDVPSHETAPLVGSMHVWHDGPQAWTVLLATQVGAVAVPRWQNPGVLQTTRQPSAGGSAWLSHTAMPFAGGAGQAVHDVPHELTLELDAQVPVPAGQRWKPALQAVPHVLDVQTAWALGSDGFAHVWHDAVVPHCAGSSSA